MVRRPGWMPFLACLTVTSVRPKSLSDSSSGSTPCPTVAQPACLARFHRELSPPLALSKGLSTTFQSLRIKTWCRPARPISQRLRSSGSTIRRGGECGLTLKGRKQSSTKQIVRAPSRGCQTRSRWRACASVAVFGRSRTDMSLASSDSGTLLVLGRHLLNRDRCRLCADAVESLASRTDEHGSNRSASWWKGTLRGSRKIEQAAFHLKA